MLKIYGNRLSGNCNKVEYVAKLTKTPYEYVVMDFQKDLKTPWFLKIHPAGKVPAIDDDGFVLFESGAICTYLCEKTKSSLLPVDLKMRALVEQWMDFSVQHVGNAIGKVAFNRVFAPMMNLPADENSIKEGLSHLERFLPIVEAQLSKSSYFVGTELSLADITLVATLEYAEMAKIDLSGYHNLVNWRKRIMEMPFYTKTP